MITLFEDNAGGLHMTDGKIVVSGMEHQKLPGGMREDFERWSWREALDWESDDYTVTEFTGESLGAEIAYAAWPDREIHLSVHLMGVAGRRYANIRTPEEWYEAIPGGFSGAGEYFLSNTAPGGGEYSLDHCESEDDIYDAVIEVVTHGGSEEDDWSGWEIRKSKQQEG